MRFFVILLALAVASPVLAQPAQPAPQQDRREKIKKRIRALRAYTLTEELSLDEQTAGKLFPMLAKYDDEFDKLLATRADLQKRLVASAQIKDPKEVDKLIDDATANQRALWDTEGKRLAEMRKILTPAQVARVLVVLPAMERKIQNQLRKAAQPKAAPPPSDDGDDADLVNPFADGPRHPRRQDKQGPSPVPCDPFSSKHGCANK